MPVGRRVSVGDMLAVSDIFRKGGRSGNFAVVTEDFVTGTDGLDGYFDVELDEAGGDYVYVSRKLVELKGRRLNKKKNLLSQFKRNNPDYVCRSLKESDREDCFRLAEKWCRIKSCEVIGYKHETSALRRAFAEFDELGLEGKIIVTDGSLAAFSIFSRQRNDTGTVHFEKYNPLIKGAAQAINWETAKYLGARYIYINREEDLGLEGLRRSKKSYCPEYRINIFNLVRKFPG
jgi:hypothetical protein